MPLKFQGCDANSGDQLMTCCLNTTGRETRSGLGCAPCKRCQFTEWRVHHGRRFKYRCHNTTCVDARYCWVHAKKRYGVATEQGRYGRQLRAEKDFRAGEYIAPLGGVPVRGHWEDLASRNATALYGYPLWVAQGAVLHRRPGRRGFIADIPDPKRRVIPPAVMKEVSAWPVAQRISRHDTHFVRAVTVRRAGGTRMFLVHRSQYPQFLTELVRRAAARLQVAPETIRTQLVNDESSQSRDALHKFFDLRQFEAYVDVAAQKRVTVDATCRRGMGSYANDPATVGGGDNALLALNAEDANAVIDRADPFPLAKNPSGWLRAIKPISKGAEIRISYGAPYWRTFRAVRYGVSRVPTLKAPPSSARVLEVGEPLFPRDKKCTLKR